MQSDIESTRLVRVMTALWSEAWLLPPNVHETLTRIVLAHAAGGEAEAHQHAAAAQMMAKPAARQFEVVDGIAVIPVEGIIGRKFANALYSSGVTSSDVLQRMISVAKDDDDVRGIVMTFDSPGGLAMGTPEVAAVIHAAGFRKPTVAYVDGICGSAAYWMASQSQYIMAMPSADVGSIGAYIAVLDQSRAAEMAGLKVRMFNGGATYKGMGYPGTELTHDQMMLLDSRVKQIAADFKASVRRGRGQLIADDAMQGQSFSAGQAKDHHLIDEVGEFEAALRAAAMLANKQMRREENR